MAGGRFDGRPNPDSMEELSIPPWAILGQHLDVDDPPAGAGPHHLREAAHDLVAGLDLGALALGLYLRADDPAHRLGLRPVDGLSAGLLRRFVARVHLGADLHGLGLQVGPRRVGLGPGRIGAPSEGKKNPPSGHEMLRARQHDREWSFRDGSVRSVLHQRMARR